MTDFLSAAELASLIGCEANQHQEIVMWLDHHHWATLWTRMACQKWRGPAPPVKRPPPSWPLAEARYQASAAEAEREAARAATAAAREKAAALAAQLAEAGKTLEKNQTALAVEREAHAATQAWLEAGGTALEAARRQLDELRTQFSAELERARADRRR